LPAIRAASSGFARPLKSINRLSYSSGSELGAGTVAVWSIVLNDLCVAV
jgi:hypothetical protein